MTQLDQITGELSQFLMSKYFFQKFIKDFATLFIIGLNITKNQNLPKLAFDRRYAPIFASQIEPSKFKNLDSRQIFKGKMIST